MHSESLTFVNDMNFEQTVLGSKTRFLLDVTAAWCGPCKTLLPRLVELQAERGETLRIGTLDADDAIDTVATLRVRGTPTLILYENGKEIGRHVGVPSPRALRALLEERAL